MYLQLAFSQDLQLDSCVGHAIHGGICVNAGIPVASLMQFFCSANSRVSVSRARKMSISPLFLGRLIRIRAHIGSLCHAVVLVRQGVGRRGLTLSITITRHLGGTVDLSITICCPRGGFLDRLHQGWCQRRGERRTQGTYRLRGAVHSIVANNLGDVV